MTITIPNFNHTPISCNQSLTFKVYNTSLLCPVWVLTCNPTRATNIQIGTTSVSILGTFSTRFQVKNPNTGTQLVMNFSVILTKQNLTGLTLVAPIPAQRYRVG